MADLFIANEVAIVKEPEKKDNRLISPVKAMCIVLAHPEP